MRVVSVKLGGLSAKAECCWWAHAMFSPSHLMVVGLSRIAFTAPVQLCCLPPLRRLRGHRQYSHQLSSLTGQEAVPALLRSPQATLLLSRLASGSTGSQDAYPRLPPSARSGDSSDSPPSPAAPSDTPFITDNKRYVHVWTDGACRRNGRSDARAGLGVWFGPGHRLNVSAPAAPPATNNSAELQAADRAVRLARHAGFSRVLVHTDSQFVMDCATRWLRVWRRNGWRRAGGGPVKNRPQLELLARAMDGATVKWNYVRGHSDDVGNVEADRLAVAATQGEDVPADTDT